MQQKHNLESFETLYKEHYAFFCLVAFHIIKDHDLAKDIVQDFFISYYQKNDSINIKTSFKSYGSKAIKNLSLQYLEKLKKEITILNKINYPKYIEPRAFTNTSPEKNKIKTLLLELPESRKNIFLDYVLQGLSYKEIAETRNISINTVKTQMKRSYHFLRKKMISILF